MMARMGRSALVKRASELSSAAVGRGADRLLPVPAQLRQLVPDGGLRRGSTVAVTAGRVGGATSLLMALLAQASKQGSWIAVLGLPELGLAAASRLGVALDCLVLVPDPGTHRDRVLAALLDGFDIVVLAGVQPPPGPVRRQIAARVRANGSLLILFGHHSADGPLWEGADLMLSTEGSVWHGLGRGCGRLRCQELTVRVRGQGSAARPRQATLWLPDDRHWRAGGAGPEQAGAPQLHLVRQ